MNTASGHITCSAETSRGRHNRRTTTIKFRQRGTGTFWWLQTWCWSWWPFFSWSFFIWRIWGKIFLDCTRVQRKIVRFIQKSRFVFIDLASIMVLLANNCWLGSSFLKRTSQVELASSLGRAESSKALTALISNCCFSFLPNSTLSFFAQGACWK